MTDLSLVGGGSTTPPDRASSSELSGLGAFAEGAVGGSLETP